MKREKKFFTVRKKLIAAASSLGVAMIMVVSSTYAWFTLSTAPEVTGISTQIGANGNLEMALLPSDGNTSNISSGIVGAGASATTTNTYWGNLVNLSDASYGLNEINLKPSRLNLSGDAETGYTVAGYSNGGSILKTPVYGSDGRVTGVEANTTSAIKHGSAFTTPATADTQEWGVRAIGTANGKSVQEVAYQNAKNAITSNQALAKSAAQRAVALYGSDIANIAVTHAMASGAAESYSYAQMNAIKNFAIELDKAFDYIDTALRQAIVAKATSVSHEAFNFDTAKATIENKNNALSTLASNSALNGVDIPTEISTLFTTVEGNRAKLTADTWGDAGKKGVTKFITDLTASGNESSTYQWSDFSEVFGYLVDSTKITINGMTVEYAMANKGELATSIMNKGLTVSTPTGSGVMADVADYVGNYSAQVTIAHLEYNGLSVDNVNAKLEATTTKSAPDLETIANKVKTFTPVGNGSLNVALTDYYGYALDFAFRTNAANSKLLMQGDPAQRIYSDSTNSLTQGGGTYFEFTSSDLTMFNKTGATHNLARLMSALRVVFTDGTGNVLAIGATSRTISEGNVSYVENTDYKVDGDTIKAYIKLYNYTLNADGILTLGAEKENQELLSLPQNQATKLSTIVYLDGDLVDNSMVSAFENISGNLNLQFASDATLIPMDNSDLKGPSMTYTQYKYQSKDYYKGSDNLWYTKSGNSYTLVEDTALLDQLNAGTDVTLVLTEYELTDTSYWKDTAGNWYSDANGNTKIVDESTIANLNSSATPKTNP